MSQIPIIDPSRIGPAPGGAQAPSASGASQRDSSFNDHLERAGRPAELAPAREAHSAATTRSDEPSSRRDPEVDEDQPVDRPIVSDSQADTGTTEDSAGDLDTIDETAPEAESDQPPASGEEAGDEGDVLQLSDDAELVELPTATGDTEPSAAAVASGENGTADEARSAAAADRRRSRSAQADGSATSRGSTGPVEGEVGHPDDKSIDALQHRARYDAARRREIGSEVTAAEKTPETVEGEDADGTTLSTTKEKLPGDTVDRPALPSTDEELAPTRTADEAADVNKPGHAAVLPSSGHRSNGSAEDNTQAAVSEQPADPTSKSHGAAPHGEHSSRQPSSREENSRRAAPRQSISATQNTSANSAAEMVPAELAVATEASNIENDRPNEVANAPTKLTVESIGEIERTPPRNTNTMGSRLATGRLGESERGSIDRARFVGRVAGAIQAAGREGGEVRLRLHPPELGVVKLEIKMDAGVMTARFETETPSARTALLDNMAALRERLAEQGIKIDKFDVDLMDRRSEESPYGPSDGKDREDERPTSDRETSSESASRRDGESESAPSTTPAVAGNAGQINVVI